MWVIYKNATQEKKRRHVRKKADIPQIQKWEILQKDDFAQREVPMPVCEQKRSRGWLSWLFGTKKETIQTIYPIQEVQSREVGLNVSDREESK